MHEAPSAQHVLPQMFMLEQHLPCTHSWPRGQHWLPHCCETAQHWPKKQVSMLLQHCWLQTRPGWQHWPLSRQTWPCKHAHNAPLCDCSVTTTEPPVPGAGAGVLWGDIGREGVGARGGRGALGFGGGGKLILMHCMPPMHTRGGKQHALLQTSSGAQQPPFWANPPGLQQLPVSGSQVIASGQEFDRMHVN